MYFKCPEGDTFELRRRYESSKIIVRENPRKDNFWMKYDNTKSEGLCFCSVWKLFLLHFLHLGVPPFPFSILIHLGAPAGILFFFFLLVFLSPFTVALQHCLVNTCFLRLSPEQDGNVKRGNHDFILIISRSLELIQVASVCFCLFVCF